jgi:hypothetical protein
MQPVEGEPSFRRNVSPPSSRADGGNVSSKRQLTFKGQHIVLSHKIVLKMETICSSETSVYFQPTTWRYIREDNHLCENLKFYVVVICPVQFM